jgi:hypothetical protein
MLLLHVQCENPYDLNSSTKKQDRAYATNKELHEAIADLKEYKALIENRSTAFKPNMILLSVSEIDNLTADEMKFMGITLIEGMLEAIKAHPAISQ